MLLRRHRTARVREADRSSLDRPLATQPQVLALRIEVMLLLADEAACWTVCLLVRMLLSIVCSTFALSTFVQFFAVGTNQVTFADCARAPPGVPLTRLSREVVFGR